MAVLLVMVMLVTAFLLFASSGIPNAAGSNGLVSASSNLNAAMGAMGVLVITGISLMAISRRRR